MSDAQEPEEIKYPAVDPQLKATQCVCKSKLFFALVLPNLRDGSAQVKVLNCAQCGAMVELHEGFVGTRKANVHIDGKGRKHHTLRADPMNFGSKGGSIGGSNGGDGKT